MSRLLIIAAVIGLVLALPAGSSAQSAGDQQYNDPFAGENAPPSNGGGGGGGNQGQPVTTPNSAPASGEEGASAGSTGVGATEGATAGSTGVGELPRSGFNAWALAALGLALLMVGTAVRGLLLLVPEPPSYLAGGTLGRPRGRRLRFGR